MPKTPLSNFTLCPSQARCLSLNILCSIHTIIEREEGVRERKRVVVVMEEQAEMVGRAFVEHYYRLFDTDRGCLSSLYHPTSMITFEGQKIVGIDNISAKLSQLPFNQCRHLISTVDSQPSSTDGGIVVFVSGSLQLPEEEHLLIFSQMFHLIPSPVGGSFFVQNDIFRLNYG